MRVGDLVSITEQRGTGAFYNETPLGYGIVLEIKKTDDVHFGQCGPVNLGDSVMVYVTEPGKVQHFVDRSLEVISD